jgi:hypothetical protein
VLKSELSLESAASLNPKVLRLFDTSHYCQNETIENYLIEVLPVNKAVWVTFHVQRGFSLALNSSNLLYKKAFDSADLVELPDGVYEFKQSFKPNLYTVQHYLHLRTVSLERKIRSQREKLLSKECSLSKEDFQHNREALREIEEYAQAAKWKVEECHEKGAGIELYQWAEKLLEYYTNECQC